MYAASARLSWLLLAHILALGAKWLSHTEMPQKWFFLTCYFQKWRCVSFHACLSVLAAHPCVAKLFKLPFKYSRFPFCPSKIVTCEVKEPDLPFDLFLLFAHLSSQIHWKVVVLESFTVINVSSSHLKMLPVIYVNVLSVFKARLDKALGAMV